jgi:hypothetical protein
MVRHVSWRGFKTCLILREGCTGTLTLANAGHVSPYVASKEIQIDTGFH